MQLRQVLQSTDLMTHQIELSDVEDRRLWLADLCSGRSVLHVGCCDVPVFDPNTNLHVFLANHTDRLDGLDISEEGIEVVRRHVDGEYFTDPAAVTRQYDLVLVPEVLEHTPNPGDFLAGIFSVRARKYLFTVPHIQWYERTRRDGRLFHESVHGDHKAWYSPYTLLNTLRPFIDEEHDEVEVFLLSTTGSVAALLSRPFAPQPFAAPAPEAALGTEAALELAGARAAEAREASALRVLAAAHEGSPDPRLVHARLELLLGLGQTMEALRVSVAWMREDPEDFRCKELCADVMEALGDPNSARDLRAAAQRGRQ
jgi:hypothetical protein